MHTHAIIVYYFQNSLDELILKTNLGLYGVAGTTAVSILLPSKWRYLLSWVWCANIARHWSLFCHQSIESRVAYLVANCVFCVINRLILSTDQLLVACLQ